MASLTRLLRNVGGTVNHTWWVGEQATAPTGSVTATVKRLDGSAVAGSPFTDGSANPTSSFVLPVGSASNLDTYTVDWSGTVAGVARTERDYIEVCGGFMFELSEARTRPQALDARKYPTATLEMLRTEVEQEAERITHTAWVPRFKRVAVAGSGTEYLLLPVADLRALRAVSVNGVAWTTDQVNAVGLSESGVLTVSGWWPLPTPLGRRNIILEFEHGRDMPTYEMRTAGIVRLRSRANLTDTSVPYRAITMNLPDGGFYRLSTPGENRTGIPEVDAAYLGSRQDLGGFA